MAQKGDSLGVEIYASVFAAAVMWFLPSYFIGRISIAAAITVTIIAVLLCVGFIRGLYRPPSKDPGAGFGSIDRICIVLALVVGTTSAWVSLGLRERPPPSTAQSSAASAGQPAGSPCGNRNLPAHLGWTIFGDLVNTECQELSSGRWRVVGTVHIEKNYSSSRWLFTFVDRLLIAAQHVYEDKSLAHVDEVRITAKGLYVRTSLYGSREEVWETVLAATFTRSEAEKVVNWYNMRVTHTANPRRFLVALAKDAHVDPRVP